VISEGTVALSVGKIEAGLSCEAVEPSSPLVAARSAFAGFRFPTEVIVVAVRWYLWFNLSYRDVEELLVERGVEVDHVTVSRWVQRFAPLLADAARRFFRRALSTLKVTPSEVATDAAAVYPGVLDELIPSAWHHVEQYANNPIEADHSQLKHRLRPMRRLRTDQTAHVIIAGHAFLQNLRRGHYQLSLDAPPMTRVAAAFTELAQAI
jgi:transposase-like protein